MKTHLHVFDNGAGYAKKVHKDIFMLRESSSNQMHSICRCISPVFIFISISKKKEKKKCITDKIWVICLGWDVHSFEMLCERSTSSLDDESHACPQLHTS